MNLVGVLPFSLGQSAPERISPERKMMYKNIANGIIGSETETEVSIPNLTIPVGGIEDDSSLMNRLTAHVTEVWSRIPDLAVLDLNQRQYGSVPRPRSVLRIVNALKSIDDNESLPKIMLADAHFSSDDVLMRVFERYFDNESLLVLDKDGRTQGRLRGFGDLNLAALNQALISTMPETQKILAQRMMRRVGHFRIDTLERPAICTPYLFDGRFCKDEIVRSFLCLANSMSEVGQVAFLATMSPWMVDIADSLGVLLRAPSVNLADPEEVRSHIFREDTLLLIPMFDTLATARQGLDVIQSTGARIPESVFSVLSTPGAGKYSTEGGSLQYGDSIIQLRSLLEIERPEHLQGECRECQNMIPCTRASDEDEILELTAHQFWAMIDEVDFVDERDVPPHRSSLGKVPDFHDLINRNGAFLSYKTHLLLRATLGPLPSNPILLFPLEEGAQALQEAMELLQDFMSEMFNYAFVPIPRDALSAVSDSSLGKIELRDNLRSVASETVYSLEVLAQGQSDRPVILFDEFNYSGKTREALVSFAEFFGLTPIAYFSLCDLDSSNKNSRFPCVSLYQLALRS